MSSEEVKKASHLTTENKKQGSPNGEREKMEFNDFSKETHTQGCPTKNVQILGSKAPKREKRMEQVLGKVRDEGNGGSL